MKPHPLKSLLDKYGSGLLEGQYEIIQKLEKHFYPQLQKEAADYFSTLVRMPTGTGKTGVIALTAYLANHGKSTLIITPWKNLCDQLQNDLHKTFWQSISITGEKNRADYQELIKDIVFPTDRMLPSNLGKFLKEHPTRNFVLVGTLQGLQALHRNQPATYDALRTRISLVIVDEGHYEPAVLWGRSVKQLKKPTLIVTATPYRNDLKLFNVPQSQVFHYEHFRAEKSKTFPLRTVNAIELTNSSIAFEKLVKEFITEWKKIKKSLPGKTPRAIICCQNKKQVMKALSLVDAAGLSALAFHERVDADDFKSNKNLKSKFLKKVPIAKDHHEEIWIHQNKLTEGLDDKRFCAILLSYPIINDRKVIQQIGRILRHLPVKNDAHVSQKAIVFYASDYGFEEVWTNYLNFERQTQLVTEEYYREMILKFLDLQPEYEYFGKKFRKRLAPFEALLKNTKYDEREVERRKNKWAEQASKSILTPPSVLILKVNLDFDMKDFIDATSTGLVLKDSIPLNVTGSHEPIVNVNGLVLWLYALIDNSDILLSQSTYEISFETRFAYKVKKYLFIGDTGGVSVEDYIGVFAQACTYFDLAKCLDKDYAIRQAGMLNTQSLNKAVRRAIRVGMDLTDAPIQVSEKKYLLQNLRAKKKGRAGDRYFGLSTGRISDRVGQQDKRKFNLGQFKVWADELAKTLDSNVKHESDFIKRYASLSAPPINPVPHSLILDPSPDPYMLLESGAEAESDDWYLTWQIPGNDQPVDLDETVFECVNNPLDIEWPYKIVVHIVMDSNEYLTEVMLQYDSKRNIFRFKKGDTSNFEVGFKGDTFSVAHILNRLSDRYTITLKDEELIYHNKKFFWLDYSQAESMFFRFMKKIPGLSGSNYEKIPSTITDHAKRNLKKWPNDSVFDKTLKHVITKANFGEIEFLFCDDPSNEIADFIVANFTERKIAFVHCKFGRGKILSASAFHDLCSQAAKNLVYIRTPRIPPNVSKWSRGAFWEGTKIRKWIKGGKSLPEKGALWNKISEEILRYSSGQAEVWLVMGDGLDVDNLSNVVVSKNETTEVGPLLHLLDGLVANCAEASVGLRVFGH